MVDPDTRAPDQFPISRPAGTVQPAASCIERPHQLANRPRDQDAIPAAIRRLKRRNAFKQQTEFMRDAMPTRHRPDARRDISHVQDRDGDVMLWRIGKERERRISKPGATGDGSHNEPAPGARARSQVRA